MLVTASTEAVPKATVMKVTKAAAMARFPCFILEILGVVHCQAAGRAADVRRGRQNGYIRTDTLRSLYLTLF
jgi:hypothetical protein